MKKLAILTTLALASQAAVAGPIGVVRYKMDYDLTNEKSDNNLTRMYLGYKGEVGDNVLGTVIVDGEMLDVGTVGTTGADDDVLVPNGKQQLEVFVKNAFFTWKDAAPMTSLSFGLQGLGYAAQADGNWGYAFLRNPVVLDGLGLPTADLGIAADIKPSEELNIRFEAMQGNGHKKIDGNMEKGTGAVQVEFAPGQVMASIGVRARPYQHDDSKEMELVPNLHFGVKTPTFRAGVELAARMNKDGSDADSHQKNALAAYGVVPVNAIIDALARCEFTQTGESDSDYIKAQAGIAVLPAKKVAVALKYDIVSDAAQEELQQAVGLFAEAKF